MKQLPEIIFSKDYRRSFKVVRCGVVTACGLSEVRAHISKLELQVVLVTLDGGYHNSSFVSVLSC